MSTFVTAILRRKPYEIMCELWFLPADEFHLKADEAEVSLIDGSDGRLMHPGAVAAACLSGLRYGRNSLPDDAIVMELLRVSGTCPQGDLTDLAACISEILRFLGEAETMLDQAETECGAWKIDIRTKSCEARPI